MEKGDVRFSIIILSKRGKEALEKVVNSVKEHTTDYELILRTEVGGYNTKLNNAVKKAKGYYLIFLHDDCEVTPGWLDEVDECGSFHVGEWSDTLQYWGGFYPGNVPCTNPSETPFYNAFCMLSKEVVSKVFPLDEYFEHPWGADVDWGYKIREEGYQLKCLSGKIIHYQSSSAQGPQEQVDYIRKKWNV